MRLKKLGLNAVAAVCVSVSAALPAMAGDLKVGMSTALTGPASALGNGVKTGVEAYFKEVNAAGGVNGNTLTLVAKDDGYEPDRAAPNMHEFVGDDSIVAVMGNVGTPTAIVSEPIANEGKTLLFGAFTGAGVLRKEPPERYIINYRASYAQETEAMVKGLLKAGIKPEEIALFTQNDGYGDAGYKGAMAALKSAGYADAEKLAHGRYTRNTLNVEEGLANILDAEVEPKAIIMVGAYAPNAAFIKLAKQAFPDALFLNVSFVGSAALLKALDGEDENVIVTQVVPHFNADLPTVQAYRKALAAYSPDAKPDFVSLEGYLIAKLFVEGLKKASSADREGIVDGLLSLGAIDLGIGVPVQLTPSHHQASSTVWPTIIKNGAYTPLNWADLKQ